MELIYALLQIKNNLLKKRGDNQISKKLDEFEKLINENDLLTDQDINSKIYDKKNLSPTYYSLKYRFEERLINELFLICSSEEDLISTDRAKIQIEKNTLIAQLMLKSFFRKEGIMLLEKEFKLAKKFTLPELTIRQIHSLLNHYSFVEPNASKMKYYLDEIDYELEAYNAEIYVKKCNAIISNMYVTTKGGFNKSQLDTMKEMVEKMQTIKQRFKTNFIISFVNDLTFFYYQTIGDFNCGLKLATEALNEITNLPTLDKLGIYQSKKNIAIANFHLHNYIKATIDFEDAISILTKGTRNWFNATSLYYLNLIYARDYEKLLELSISVLTNKNLSKFPYFEEQWKLREAYLHFLIKSEIIKIDDNLKKDIKPFSLSKFLNSVPFHTKDKSGQNITIIIIQVLFLLLDNKYGKIIDKIDSLTQYTYRYLHRDETFRSNCFIKMLLLMIKADFHPVRTESLTSELIKKLKNSHLITDEKSTQVEIIPFDYLWELIVDILKEKQAK
jgi:hypothetical protein